MGLYNCLPLFLCYRVAWFFSDSEKTMRCVFVIDYYDLEAVCISLREKITVNIAPLVGKNAILIALSRGSTCTFGSSNRK